MKYTFFVLSLAFFSLSACAQKNETVVTEDYLVAVWDTVGNMDCGYVNKAGEYIIPKGAYPLCLTDTFRTFAIVYKSNRGFVGIDRTEEVLFQVMPYDNGPDFPSEGMFRIIEDNKIGFASLEEGKIIVPPTLDAAYPFSEGLAAFCEGCQTKQDGEHSYWANGKWGFIDKDGKIAIPAQFLSARGGFEDGKIKVKTEKGWVIIDKTGKVLEVLKKEEHKK